MTNPRMLESTSPYLRAHADNPVEWHEWNQQTLQLAREQDRPILLSIGYAACHWCHVMARESFSDPAIAAVMNQYFVNIKVDREERPDLDKTFQTAHALLNQRGGGWPLTAFLNPDDLSPFFIGTYFPAKPHFGMPGFTDLLEHVHQVYRQKGDQTRQQGAVLHQALASMPAGSGVVPPISLVDAARARFEASFDQQHGGLGSAPKFPQLPVLGFLLDEAASRGADGSGALDHAVAALLDGGLFDHLDGGIFRYCVDADWTIPHFEKMLVDNAQLPATLARFAAMGSDSRERRAVVEPLLDRCIDHFLGRMQLPDGTFAASLDADTKGEEGATYLWMPDELRDVLRAAGVGAGMIEGVIADYDLDRQANFEGRWHLAAAQRAHRVADVRPLNDAFRLPLLAHRDRRAQPKRDDKSLLGLNALLATSLLHAGNRLERDDWVLRGLELLDRLIPDGVAVADLPTGRLGGRGSVPAFLDDYAALLEAQTEGFLQAPTAARLGLIESIVAVIEARFADESGAFRLSHDAHRAPVENLIMLSDDDQPGGNALLADTLARLGYLLGRSDWLERAEGIFKAAAGSLERAPQAHPRLLAALRRFHQPATTVVIKAHDLQSWQQAIRHLRARGIAMLPTSSDELFVDKPLPANGGLAYVCRGTSCLPPESDPDRLLAQFT